MNSFDPYQYHLKINHIVGKVSEYKVFSGLNGENTDQEKFRIWTLFTLR